MEVQINVFKFVIGKGGGKKIWLLSKLKATNQKFLGALMRHLK